jgi:hypothetical protein
MQSAQEWGIDMLACHLGYNKWMFVGSKDYIWIDNKCASKYQIAFGNVCAL